MEIREGISEIPATYVESFYLTDDESWKGRAISTTVFPLFALIDLAIYSYKALKERTWVFIASSSEKKQAHFEEAMRCGELAVKYFLGIIASPIGFIFPDLVTHHFLPDRSNPSRIEPYGKLYSVEGTEKTPESVQEVVDIVRQARKENRKLTVSGARMSQGKQILPTDQKSVSINMLKMNKVKIDPIGKTATVEAGARWSDVQRAANEKGLAIRVMQASNIFSVGGSLGANVHGWDHQSGTLAETVHKIWVVDAAGQIKLLTPKDELFGLIIGGYGQFGVIVKVELSLADNEELLHHAVEVSSQDYVNYFEKEVLSKPEIRMHLYRLSIDFQHLLGKGVAVNYTLEGPAEGKKTPHLQDEKERGSWMDRVLLHIARRSKIARKVYWEYRSKNMQTNRELSTRNAIMRPPINAILHHSIAESEWLQEFFVPGKDLALFLKNLGEILKENQVPLLNATVRYVKQDHISQMGYARDGNRYAVVLCFSQQLTPKKIAQTKNWIQRVNEELLECSGSYYLPYQPFATQKQFERSYKNAAYVAAKKLEYDPEGRFENGLSKEYFQKVEPQHLRKWSRAS